MVCLPLSARIVKKRLFNHYSIFHPVILLISALFFLNTPACWSQRKADIGFFSGISCYQGEISQRPFYSPGFTIGPVYRYNFHARTSIRLSALYNNLKGSDLDFEDDVRQLRAASFNMTGTEFAAAWEFNFLPYKTAFRKTKYSPYVSAGIGYHLILSSDVMAHNHLTIPFGLGFKFNITQKLSAGIENTYRKTYYDNIDGIENFSMDEKYRLLGNKDWFTFTGFFLTYKIFKYREDCPTYD